ncbi:MAG: outer membrane protein assembly factor BamE [Legionellaceae bacterium]|nr:outer membrane protein assembly factor BamE [Legionellaceae bacterium]
MTNKRIQILSRLMCSALIMLSLTHCASYDFSRRIVQQGNLLPETKIKQLKPGMTKEEVAIFMGTSLLSPTFNNDRWDYAYTWRKGSHSDQVRHLSIYFSNNRVTRIQT